MPDERDAATQPACHDITVAVAVEVCPRDIARNAAALCRFPPPTPAEGAMLLTRAPSAAGDELFDAAAALRKRDAP
jgi:hypothetical protein